jgi:hypothetical protein
MVTKNDPQFLVIGHNANLPLSQQTRGSRGFYFAIYLRAKKEHKTGEVEPCKKNDHRPQTAIGDGVIAEEVDVDTEANGGEEPSDDADDRTRTEPVPMAALHIGCEVIDNGEE